MIRRITLIVVCLGLACGGVACASPRVGPTSGSGYVFSMQVDELLIYRLLAARLPAYISGFRITVALHCRDG